MSQEEWLNWAHIKNPRKREAVKSAWDAWVAARTTTKQAERVAWRALQGAWEKWEAAERRRQRRESDDSMA